MNIQHSVNVPALSGKRSMLRRLVTAATMGALMLGVVSASADGGGGHGKFTLVGSASGGIAVKGKGKFKVRDVDGKLIFESKVGGCTDIEMADGRQEHTCSEKTKINGMKGDSVVKLVIEKSALKFPEGTKSSSGSAPGKVHFLGKASDVKVEYTVSQSGGGKYKVSSASFKFDYLKHTNEVCLGVKPAAVCVKPEFTVTVDDAEIEAKK